MKKQKRKKSRVKTRAAWSVLYIGYGGTKQSKNTESLRLLVSSVPKIPREWPTWLKLSSHLLVFFQSVFDTYKLLPAKPADNRYSLALRCVWLHWEKRGVFASARKPHISGKKKSIYTFKLQVNITLKSSNYQIRHIKFQITKIHYCVL